MEPIKSDREADKRRNRIERVVSALEQFHRVAPCYEKTARAFLSMPCIGAARTLSRYANTA